MVELAQVLYQQATCGGWSSSNWMLYLMMHYHLAALKNPLHASVSSTGATQQADWRLRHQRRACVISKMKMEIYHWRWKMKQQQHSSDCFLSWPQLWAHTLLTCCHLSLSRAFASSPAGLARTGAARATAKPSLRALQDLKQVCHWELLKFNRAGDARRVGHAHVHTGNPVVETNVGPFISCLYKCRFPSRF